MTVIRPNAISGITSLTAQGDVINFFKSDGTLSGLEIGGARINATGISTFTTIKVGTAQTLDASGINVTGVITATSFEGDGTNLTNTGSTLSAASGSQRVVLTGQTSGIMTASATDAALTFTQSTGTLNATNLVVTGNASIGGTVTYMDVTNVDSVGIITAQVGLQVLANGINITGVSTVAAGSAAAPSISPTGDTDTGIFFPAADTIAFGEGGSEALRINSSGNLGIGTNNPTQKLDVLGAGQFLTNGAILNLIGTDHSYIQWYPDGVAAGRKAYTGFPDSTANYFAIANEISDGSGHIYLIPGTSASVIVSGVSTFNGGINASQGADLARLRVTGITTVAAGSAAAPSITPTGDSDTGIFFPSADTIAFGEGGSEAVRIDSSGRLLVGTTTFAQSNSYSNGQLLSIAGNPGSGMQLQTYSNDVFAIALDFSKSRSATVGTNTIVQNGDSLGNLIFNGFDGASYKQAASIAGAVDAAPGTNDMPGRLVFSTTADGASSPTERMRITSGGYVKSSNNGSYYASGGSFHESTSNITNEPVHLIYSSNSSYGSPALWLSVARSASSAYSFLVGYSGINADIEFYIRGDGNAFADGTWTGGGADYAEYFEWFDSNPAEEDRRGISVVLDGDKIRAALPGEDPIGVISANPSVVGDAAWNKWSGKYLRDDYGTYIQEDYEVEDEDGNTVIQQRRKLNPAYDPDLEYISRENRPEWDCVGLMGKLRIRKGQATGSRWIKMRDINDSVEEWLVR